MVRIAIKTLIQETIRNGFSILPKFVLKCEICGAEYKQEIEECEVCGSTHLRKPNKKELSIINSVINGQDISFLEILRSSLFWGLATGNFFWALSKVKIASINLTKITVIDPRTVLIAYNKHGELKSNEWFCANPECYNPAEVIESETQPKCPKCGKPMSHSVYIQVIGGEVKSRFSDDEIIHGAFDRHYPEIFGVSRIVSVWKILHSLENMDELNYEYYKTGHLSGIINFPGYTQAQVDQVIRSIEAEKNKLTSVDLTTGKISKPKRVFQLFLGSQEPIVYTKTTEDLQSMQTLPFHDRYRSIIAAVFGVTPSFVAIPDPNRGYQPVMQINVQNRTTKEIQAVMEDVINNQLFKKLNVSDFIFKFNEIEAEDELRKAEILDRKARATLNFVRAGLNVEVDPLTNEIKISGKGKLTPALVPTGKVEDEKEEKSLYDEWLRNANRHRENKKH